MLIRRKSKVTVLELEDDVRRAAGHHTRGSPELFDDFLQEMWVALLEAPGGKSLSWYMWRATWRAVDWLRREMTYRAWHLTMRDGDV